MEITKSSSKGLKHSFTVTVKAETIEMQVKNRILEVGKTAKIPGFRPGKAPLQVLQQRYEVTARPEVVRKVIDDTYRKVLTDKKLRPAARPEIVVDSYSENADLVCSFEVEVLPIIEDIDLAKVIKAERPVAEVDDKLMEETLKRIASNNKTTAPLKKERAAKKGDTVIIDFEGRTEDGPISGGSGKGIALELGSGYFIPGFEEQLEGAKKDEHKTVNVSFPQDYNAKDLAGKKATFEVTVHEIQETVLPEINEEYAKSLGFETLDALKEIVKNQLQQDNDRLSFTVVKRKILDLLDSVKVELPESLVINEVHQLDPEHNHHDCDHGSSEEQAEEEAAADEKEDKKKSKAKKDKSDSKEAKELRELAERRVRLGLILADIGNKNEVHVTQKEMQQAMLEQARRYPGQEQQVLEYLQKNEGAQQAIRAPIFEDKVIALAIEKGKVTDKKVSRDELEKAAQEANEQ